MVTQQEQEIVRLSDLARTFLVRARIAKQHAVIVMETWNNTHSDAEIRRVATSHRQDAYQFRKEAREILKFIEKKNGMRYLGGFSIFPLRTMLNGRDFRNWPEHKTEYEFESLYQGMDPC